MSKITKVEENRLRRVAQRQGLGISRSRRRDKRALDYGQYVVYRLNDDSIIGEGWDVDTVRSYLEGEEN